MDKEPTDNTINYGNGEFEDIAGTPMIESSETQTVPMGTGANVPEAEAMTDDALEQKTADSAAMEEGLSNTPAPDELTPIEPVVVDPMEKAERAADIAESDAKELNHLKKVVESDKPLVTTHDEQLEAKPVDVRQDFIDQMYAPKKSHKMGLGKKLAIIIVAVIVLGAAGFFTWWFAYYSQPSVVLADALGKFISADSINSGAILKTTDGDESAGEILLTSEVHGLTESSHFLVVNSAEESDDETNAGLSAEAIMLDDGGLFVKVNGAEMLAVGNGTATGTEVLDEIDGKWYQLGIEDILQFFGLDDETVRPITDFYNCSVAVAGQDYSKEITALYKSHPFLTAEKSIADAFTRGATVYDISIDYVALADFLNNLPNLGMAESFYVCYNTMAESLGNEQISAESFAEISAEDLADFFPEDYLLQFEIRNFGHELARVVALWSDGDIQQQLSIDLDYTYQEIELPESYWTPEDLITAAQEYSTAMFEQITIAEPEADNEEDVEDEDNEWNNWYDDDGWYLGEDLYEDEEEDDE